MVDIAAELRIPRLRTLDAFRRARILLSQRRSQADEVTKLTELHKLFHALAEDVDELLDALESTQKENSHAEG